MTNLDQKALNGLRAVQGILDETGYDVHVMLTAREGEYWKIEESLKIGGFTVTTGQNYGNSKSIWTRFTGDGVVGGFTDNSGSSIFPNAMCVEFSNLIKATQYVIRLRLKVVPEKGHPDPTLIGKLEAVDNGAWAGVMLFVEKKGLKNE